MSNPLEKSIEKISLTSVLHISMKQVYTYHVREYKYPSKSLFTVNIDELFQLERFSIKVKSVWVDYNTEYDVFTTAGSDDVDEYVGRKNRKLVKLLRDVRTFEIEAESDALCHYLNFHIMDDKVQCRLARQPWCEPRYLKLKAFMKRCAEEERDCVVCLEKVGCVGVVDTFMCCGTTLHSACCAQLLEDRCPICRTWCYR